MQNNFEIGIKCIILIQTVTVCSSANFSPTETTKSHNFFFFKFSKIRTTF